MSSIISITKVSQTLLRNPKGPVELGKLNTNTEVKLCLFFIYSGSRNSLARDWSSSNS